MKTFNGGKDKLAYYNKDAEAKLEKLRLAGHTNNSKMILPDMVNKCTGSVKFPSLACKPLAFIRTLKQISHDHYKLQLETHIVVFCLFFDGLEYVKMQMLIMIMNIMPGKLETRVPLTLMKMLHVPILAWQIC